MGVYENQTTEQGEKAIIHRGSCAFCKEGQGIHKNIPAGMANGTDPTKFTQEFAPCRSTRCA